MTSTIRLPENNGLETCHSMLVFRHILGRKDIKLEVQNFRFDDKDQNTS